MATRPSLDEIFGDTQVTSTQNRESLDDIFKDTEQIDTQEQPKGVFGQVEKAQTPKKSWWDSYMNVSRKAHEAYQGVHTGIAKGVASTVAGVASLGEKALTKAEQAVFGDVSKERLEGPAIGKQVQEKYLQPEGAAENIGFGLEQLGELAMPLPGGAKAKLAGKAAGAVDKASDVVKLGERGRKVAQGVMGAVTDVVPEVLEAGVKTAAQTGDLEQAKDAAKITGIVGGGLKAVETARKAVAPLGGRVINSLVKPGKRDFAYNKNPGKTLAEEGITANSMESLRKKVSTRIKEVGSQIDEALKDKIVNAKDALSPIDDAIREAAEGGEQNAALIRRLQQAKEALQYTHAADEAGNIIKTGQRDLSSLAGNAARELKTKIGKMAKWTDNPSDDEFVNKTMQKVYGKLKGAMERTAPETKKLNSKLADFLSADSAIANRMNVAERQNLVGFGTKEMATIATVGAFADGDMSLEDLARTGGITALTAALGTPAAKTRIAKWLAKTPAKEKTRLYKAIPGMKRLFTSSGNDMEESVDRQNQ